MKYADSLESVESITTGLFIDKITNGIPRGKITEVWGDAGVGKSTLCLQSIAAAQTQGLKCLWVDTEWSYDANYAKLLGVDNSKLGIIREIEKGENGIIYSSAEANLDALVETIEKSKYDLVILDSIGALIPRAEFEKQLGEKIIGGQAGIIARFCRRIVPILAVKETALILINHSFTDIMSGKLMTSGGRKLEYHKSLSIRLKVKSGVSLKSGDTFVGKVIIAELRKDKVNGNERAEAEGQLIFHQGFSKSHDQFEEELKSGVIKKEGQSFFRNGVKLGRGKMAAAEALKSLAATL